MTCLTREEKDALSALRDKGCAVVVFTPDELGGMPPFRLEEGLVADGNDRLDFFHATEGGEA